MNIETSFPHQIKTDNGRELKEFMGRDGYVRVFNPKARVTCSTFYWLPKNKGKMGAASYQ
jgi:hypothetical protein